MSAETIISRVARGADLDAVRSMLSKRPITTNSISNTEFDPATIYQDAQQTRIVVHKRYCQLVEDFLEHKRNHGTSIERDLYCKEDWTWKKQVARLVEKRPLMFMTESDATMLRDGHYGGSLAAEWDRIGTESQSTNKYLTLAEYLSYDEIMLGSLLGVSSPSYFINNGSRRNRGIPGAPGSFEPRGVIIGLVGARFERPDRMDSIYMQPAVSHPRQHAELAQVFRRFFLGDAVDPPPPGRRTRSSRSRIAFDANMYRSRMRVTAEILLLEANARAGAAERKAYVSIVGLGLGVWAVDASQPQLYVEAFAKALSGLAGTSELDAVGTLDFTWVSPPASTRALMADTGRRHGIDVLFSRREPAAALVGDKAGQLLVLSYAWDGNAYPGNEYWMGSLSASGDPAAAAMSTISELHNPVINPDFLQRIQIAGAAQEEEYHEVEES